MDGVRGTSRISGWLGTHQGRWTVMVTVMLVAWLATVPAGAIQAPLVTLRVDTRPRVVSHGPIYIAMDEGYFEREGLRIELVPLSGSDLAITLLSQGAIDVFNGLTEANFFNALARGLQLRIVADKWHSEPGDRSFGLVVRKELHDHGLRTAAGLAGRRIAIPTVSGFGGYFISQLLASGKVSLKDVTLVPNLRGAVLIEALQTGAVDAGLLFEPDITIGRRQGVSVPLAFGEEVVPGQQVTMVIFGPNLLIRNREAGVRYLRAYLRGVQRYSEGKTPSNLRIMARRLELDEAILREASWPPISKSGTVNGVFLMRLQDWLYESRFIDVRIPLQQMLDVSFVERALAAPARP